MFPLSYGLRAPLPAEEISAPAEKHEIELQFSSLVNTINVSLYYGNCAQINAILATVNVTNYGRLIQNCARNVLVRRANWTMIVLY